MNNSSAKITLLKQPVKGPKAWYLEFGQDNSSYQGYVPFSVIYGEAALDFELILEKVNK